MLLILKTFLPRFEAFFAKWLASSLRLRNGHSISSWSHKAPMNRGTSDSTATTMALLLTIGDGLDQTKNNTIRSRSGQMVTVDSTHSEYREVTQQRRSAARTSARIAIWYSRCQKLESTRTTKKMPTGYLASDQIGDCSFSFWLHSQKRKTWKKKEK